MSNLKQNDSGKEKFPWSTVRKALLSDHEGIYDWDITHDSIKYSEYCLDLLGISDLTTKAPNIFKDFSQVVVEDSQQHFATNIRRYLELHSDQPLRIETKIYTNVQRTTWRWVRITGIASRNADHKAFRLVGAIVDISRRKTAEFQLEEEKHRFRLLIDHIPDNIFYKNRESRFVIANASTAKKMNVPTPSDLIGKTDAHFFAPEEVKAWREEEIEIMNSNKASVSNLRHEYWKDGKDTWCMATKVPWRGRDGQLKGLLGVTSDVTMLVKTQLKLRKIAADLEAKNQALEKEIRLAKEVQIALLPQKVPSISYTENGIKRTLSFAHKYQPSSGVAGDWFEVFPISESTVGIFICDVMGHGVRSALVASMIRGLLEDAIKESPLPVPFLTTVNDNLSKILMRSQSTTMFATAFYVYIDLKEKIVRFSSAGHPIPFWRSGNKDFLAELNVKQSRAIGLIENTVYYEGVVDLEDHMGLLLFTDGLIEASNAEGEEIGRDRIKERLQDFRQKEGGNDFLSIALDCVKEFTGTDNFEDDICLLSVKYKEERID